jgi:hypothetical protein
MDNFSSSDLVDRMETALKEAINTVLDNFDPKHQDVKQEIIKNVNAKMSALSSQLSFYFPSSSKIEIKNFSYSPTTCNNEGVMMGDLVVAYCPKPDYSKYGGPGYPGKENAQLCEYPEYSRKFYKWNDFLCKWEDVYKDIKRNNNGQSWSHKLTNNAAFEPWWGNNTSGGNYLRSDRKRNGADDLWGDPGVGSRMGTFKQISADVMKSIYRFTLNLKSAIGHYEKLNDAFGFGDEEDNSTTPNNNNNNNDDAYTAEEEPKVTITIEKVNFWHYFMNNGHIDQSGNSVRKDTAVFVKDVDKVHSTIEKINNLKKQKSYDDFKKNN